MKEGDLVEMWGCPGVYGIIISPGRQADDYRWNVFWNDGNVTELPQILLELVNESR